MPASEELAHQLAGEEMRDMSEVQETKQEEHDWLREFPRELPVPLTEDEMQHYGKQLADKVKEEELVEERKKQINKEYGAQLAGIRAEVRRLAEARSKQAELRNVKCGERVKGNVVEIVRLDTKEVIQCRPADMRDLQTNLPGTEMIPGTSIPIEDGPRGDDLGADVIPLPTNGKSVTSSVGDEVYVSDPEEGADENTIDDVRICDACGEAVDDDDETTEYEGATIHRSCAPEGHGLVNPSFEQTQRDIAQRDAEIAEDKAKPKRERSAKKNGKAAAKRKR